MPSLLSQKAVLASLSISQWSARKLDKKVTEEIHARHHAEPHSGGYNKLLIASDVCYRLLDEPGWSSPILMSWLRSEQPPLMSSIHELLGKILTTMP